ncbi:MAG: Ni/Fe-hydrogenase cytochrome b subunit [Candidatus Binatus sp.]|uniref:NrfD/PsrC family molybdoenzyme membrane anchor subunit n=1 Tax=Candidatus Binatus sp. TaxID=2811406 RepID=UPI003C7942FF
MNAHDRPQPLGGTVFTRPVLALAVFAGIAGLLIVWRFIVGLGTSTALNDGYPWGLWIAFDVVTGTALSCGGYSVALLVYILNRGKYHPLIRPALVTSAFGYTIAGLSVVVDIGRPWIAYKLPFFWHWNLNSVLLEVSLCIMTYTVVLWLELSPAFLEWARSSTYSLFRRVGDTGLPVANKSLLWLVALGMLLPTMHQSSLGSLMLLSGPRLHPLWNTTLLPLLFLISCIAMGFGAVVMEGGLSAKFLGRKFETDMLAGLGFAMLPLIGVYLGIRLIDLGIRGQLGALFAFDHYSVMSVIELALFVAAAVLLATDRRRRDPGNLFRAAMLLVLAGALYRFDVFLVAFQPGPNYSYFPSVTEILVTSGLVAGEIAGYIVLIKLFPIMAGEPQTAAA